MISYKSVRELVALAEGSGKRLSEVVVEDQVRALGRPREELFREMEGRLTVMEESRQAGLAQDNPSLSGLVGRNARLLQGAMARGGLLGGESFDGAILTAIAIAEVNASMGRIVAAPTAGSCGILPALILVAAQKWRVSREQQVQALFTASGIGMVIANIAGVSGAAGGCQAECGSAAAMAAAAVVEMGGGSPGQSAHACAIALKNVLGLVCDPVAGLVEVPCVKRNAAGAAQAMVAADLALAGIESVIPADEVIQAMHRIGQAMPASLKETAQGGLAATPTGCRLAKELQKGNE
jgi:L-serine dehydratase